jgi:hypothetical protein
LLENPTLEIACPIFNLGFSKPIDKLGAAVFYLCYWFRDDSAKFSKVISRVGFETVICAVSQTSI